MRSLTLGSAVVLATALSTCQTQAARTAGAPAKVSRIVFMDKANDCACARERVESIWAEVHAALGENSSITVERVYIDTQPDKALPLLEQAQVMILPGVYLLAAGDELIELIEGEVKQQQLREKLSP